MTCTTPAPHPARRRAAVLVLAVMGLALSPSGSSEPASAAGTGTVTGTITVPFPGGYYGDVSLFAEGDTDPDEPDAFGSTSDGTTFTAVVPAGTYRVGFSVEDTDDYAAQFYDAAPDLASAATVVVPDGGTVGGIDATLAIDPAKGTVSGHVQAGAADPYFGSVDFYDAAGNPAGDAYSYLGDYRKVLAPGTYTAVLSADPDDPYLEKSVTVSVTAAATTTLDVDLVRDPDLASIGGVVTRPDGDPYSGVVTFSWQGPDAADHPDIEEYLYGTYDRTLRPGTYLVGFSLGEDHDGFRSQYFDGKPTPAGATLVTVVAGEHRDGVDAVLEADAADGRVSGEVTTPDGPYDGNASFFRQDGDGDAVADFTASIVAGSYDRALPPGTYKVAFDAAGADGYAAAYYDDATTLAAATPVTVTAGATTSGIDGMLLPTALPPDRPAAPAATAGVESATLTWVAPDDHGSPITEYTIVASPGGASYDVDGTQTSTTITGLTPGTSYTFTLAATNAHGTSRASAPSAPVVPSAPEVPVAPDAPTQVVATAGDGTATLSWSAPDDHGSPITGYEVTSTPAGTDFTTSSTSTMVVGLTNGATYVFHVVATNAGGRSPAGDSNEVTPFGLPSAPRGVTADGGPRSATVRWSAADPNGAPITSYVVTAIPGGRSVTVAGDATSASLDGLEDGTAYTFAVVAHNRAGPSPAGLSEPVTPASAPDAPTGVEATAGSGEVRVDWTAPASNGAAITSFTVTASPGGRSVTVAGDVTSAVLDGLEDGTAYTVAVVARNRVGDSPAAVAGPATPSSVPDAPGGLDVEVGPGRVTVAWSAPEAHGSAITGYRVLVTRHRPGSSPRTVLVDGATHTARVSGLVDGAVYDVQVVAINARGASAPALGGPVVLPARPGRIDRPVAVYQLRRHRVVVSWSAPDAHGAPITSYVVTWGDHERTVTEPRAVLRHLAPGTYRFRVVALNAVGRSPRSRPVEVVVPGR